jgi:beta-phosphoglucomutase
MQNCHLGVIFDMDGVLCHSAPAHFRSWDAVAERWGVRMTEHMFARVFGRSNRQIIPMLLGREVPEDELEQIASVKEEAYRRIVMDSIQPLPGVVALVEDLDKSGFRLAVGSSGPRRNIDLIVSLFGISDCFVAIVSGEDVPLGKPDPTIFLMAAQRIGCEPRRCLVIEDAPVGIEAARAAGMKCLAVTNTHRPSALEGADQVRNSLQGFTAVDAAELIGP